MVTDQGRHIFTRVPEQTDGFRMPNTMVMTEMGHHVHRKLTDTGGRAPVVGNRYVAVGGELTLALTCTGSPEASWYVMTPMATTVGGTWNDAPPVQLLKRFLHSNMVDGDQDVMFDARWNDCTVLGISLGQSWGTQEVFDAFTSVSSGQMFVRDAWEGLGWGALDVFDEMSSLTWTAMVERNQFLKIKNLYIIPKIDNSEDLPWGVLEELAAMIRQPWEALFPIDRKMAIQWGGLICYLMRGVVSAYPDGGNLNIILKDAVDPRRFKVDIKYAPFDQYQGKALSVRMSEVSPDLMLDSFIKSPKLPMLQPMASGEVWVSDTGSHWLHSTTLGYQESQGTTTVSPTFPEVVGTADAVLHRSMEIIGWKKSPGCYQRTVDHYTNPPKPVVIIVVIHPYVVGGSLYIMSEATLIRASDSAVIPVTSMSLTTDLSSWGWSFSANIKTAAALDMCKPAGSPVKLIATINGNSWPVLIESFTERGAFGTTDYAISGRSEGMELSAPMAPIGSTSYDTAKNLSQILDAELLRVQGMYSSEWVGVWEAQDGIIPGGTLSYQDRTPIEVIMSLAEAVGAFVYHDRSSKTLRVAPKYKLNPWSFVAGSEDLALSPTAIISTGMTWRPSPEKNGIFVSGTTADGYLCKITRQGTDGAALIPLVTDPLIVTSAIARERGRYLLNSSGKKGDYNFELPLMAPNQDLKLFTPGKVVRVYDAPNWYGVVIGVNVSAQESSGVVVARQHVDVERHFN